ncbi:MAG: hypothetical protein JO170_22940 [Verrucomicrobia bacterium]|nr:hypothetical protein [Verrucomicrobiota bacterium]
MSLTERFEKGVAPGNVSYPRIHPAFSPGGAIDSPVADRSATPSVAALPTDEGSDEDIFLCFGQRWPNVYYSGFPLFFSKQFGNFSIKDVTRSEA